MNERPIIFSGPMVRAILDGRKTQTRRVFWPKDVKITPNEYHAGQWWFHVFANRNGRDVTTGCGPFIAADWVHSCPYGQPGDRFWVRETFAVDAKYDNLPMRDVPAGVQVWCRADEDVDTEYNTRGKWRPSIFMPRWACRIRLEVTGVKVERVQDISEADAEAEGVVVAHNGYIIPYSIPPTRQTLGYRNFFACLWNDINAKRGYGWDANPWVWAITFRRVEA